MHYSSCVVERTIKMSRVGTLFGWHRVKDRPFGELNREPRPFRSPGRREPSAGDAKT